MTFPNVIQISIFIAVAALYGVISSLVKKKLRATLTALDDIDLLGLPPQDGHKIRGTAVVCGGSIAGLLSARVCADHFENVIIIEPEDWVATAEGLEDNHRQWSAVNPPVRKRSRVPQYTSLHGYQAFITLVLRKLFVNLDSEIHKAGARLVSADAHAHWSGVPIVAPLHQYSNDTFPTIILQARPGFETTLRRLVVTTCLNVEYVTGTVSGLVKDPSNNNISSVRMRTHTGDDIVVPAALVVDCTGPALGGLRWLQALSPVSSSGNQVHLTNLKATYNPKMIYTTCEFDVPPSLFDSLKALGYPGKFESGGIEYATFPDPTKDTRNLVVTRREFNFLQVTVGGWNVHDEIACIGDIQRFISQMITDRPIPQWIHLMLDLFQKENIPVTYELARCPPSVYVQYHKAENLPSNFVAIGDSILQLNPIRGQGCTKACVEAVTLNALLAQCVSSSSSSRTTKEAGSSLPDHFGRTFFATQARRTGSLWDVYKSEDYAWKSTAPSKGDDPQAFSALALRRAYGSRVIRLVVKDREVSAVWWHVGNWLASPTDLLSPKIVLKIAWMCLCEQIM